MTLQELLDELREGILHDFSDQIAGDSDQLWPDKRLVLYINQAEQRLAREALVLRDSTTPAVTKVQTCAFQREYPLHDSLIAVISVRAFPDRADLVRCGHASLDTYHVPDTYFFDPSSMSALPPGKMLAWDTDESVVRREDGSMGRMLLRVYPPPRPELAQLLNLRVIRLPICPLDLSRPNQVPEIPDEHHLDMLSWAAYLALRVVDLDEGNVARAQEFKAAFEAHVKEARAISMRKLFAPLQYGFGRNGFSWETN